jgi:uncharacterized membrane protein (DUF4010 family)
VSASQTIVEAGYAVAIGLVIGFEREHNAITEKLTPLDVPGEKTPSPAPDDVILGSRTFSLLCLGGWLVALLGDRYPAMVPVGMIALVGMTVAQYVMATRRGTSLGMTTEAAVAVTVMIGALVHTDRTLAVTLALGTVLLLVSKPWMRAALLKLRRLEVIATVQLLVAVAIVLPLLPVSPMDPWQAIPPRKLGVFVVLIAAVEYVGYVLHRLLGAARGAAVAGLLGGLTSSTAVTAAMARQARQQPASLAAGQLATFLANAVMGTRVAVVAAALSPAVALRLAAPMAVFVAVLLGGAMWRWRRGGAPAAGAPPDETLTLRNPFALVPALTWGAVPCAVLLLTTLAQRYLGDSGILLAAVAGGLADVDAITLAASRQAGDGVLPVETAALAITLAVASNTLVKGGIAWIGGGRAFGRGVVACFALALLLSSAVATALYLR